MLCAERARLGGQAALLEQYRDRDGLDWDDAKLQLIDLPVLRHPPREGPLPPARRRWAGSSGCSTTPSRARDARPARGHPRLLPRPVPGEVRRLGRRRLLGLGDLRPARPRVAAAGARPSTRCAAPRPTSATLSTAATPPRPARSTSARRTAEARQRPPRSTAVRRRLDRVESWPRSRSSRARPARRRPAPRRRSPPRPTSPSARKPLDDDIDAILDEIDEVLESNAEDFVKSFIQKGGQ